MKPIDTGLIEFKIPFSNGDEGTLCFNPNDVEFYGKIADFEAEMRKVYEEFENVKNTENPQKIINEMRKETNEKIKSIFDDLFGSGASAVIFKYASPTSFVKNQYYPYYFLSEFMPDVVKKINKTNEAVIKNAQKMFEHVAPYVSKR